MILDFLIPGVLKINMTPYAKSMIDEFPEKLSGKTKGPWNENLFKVDPMLKKLGAEQAKVFHTFVMKGMFSLQAWSPRYPTSSCIYGNKSH